ncbi:MAG: PAS domain-containing sensor histidine kinase [Pseudomonadota bacterium]
METDAELYRFLVDGVLDYAIVMLEIDGRVRTWNSGAELVYGYASSEMIGVHFLRLCTGEDVAAGKPEAELRVSLSHGRLEDEGWRVRKGGAAFWAHVVITPFSDSSPRPVGFAMVTSDLTERRKLEDDFAQANERLRALASHVNSATEREKGRLAREIHDVLGQELTGLKMDTAWITRRLGRPEPLAVAAVLQRLREMTQQIEGCVQTVRRIATGLRPGVLDDLGLSAAIDWQVHEFERRSGISVLLTAPEEDLDVDRERATALFRILQEVLTNVARHAGARTVSVVVTEELGLLTLNVRDDGRGITDQEATSSRSLGILGIRERVSPFGGFLAIHGEPSVGTRVTVRLPVSP